jgi:RND family efflux transporter MFP subunit
VSQTIRRPLTAAAKLVSVLAAVLSAAGCARKAPPPPPPTVIVAAPLSMTVVDWDDYDGQFIAVNSVDIRPRVSGYLMKVGFRDGDMVRKGQVLFEIDPRPYQAALDQAKGVLAHDQAALVNAQEQLARGRTLVAAKAISQQAFELLDAAERQAEADLATGKANVQAAALNVQFTRVTAPLAGRISDRRVAPGNLVTADTTVLTNIASINPIWFQFTGSEALYLKYQHEAQSGARPSSRTAATPVEIQLQDDATYRWRGRMDFVDNQIDPGSGAIRQRAVIENPDNFLTPGMFGHLRLQGSGPYPALLVPDTAILTDLNRRVVYVVGTDGQVSERPITPGPLYRGLRVIRAGLSPTDRVIIDGLTRAKPGAKASPKSGSITPLAPPGPSTENPSYSEPLPTSAAPAADAPRAK